MLICIHNASDQDPLHATNELFAAALVLGLHVFISAEDTGLTPRSPRFEFLTVAIRMSLEASRRS